MFWESQRGHFCIRRNVQDSGQLNALNVPCSAVLPSLRRVRGRTCENWSVLVHPHVSTAELRVSLPHFGVVERHQTARQSAGVQVSPGAPVNTGDEDAAMLWEGWVPTTSYAVVEFLPGGG